MKAVGEVATVLPTVTEIGPVVAPRGMVIVREEAVAEITVACIAPNLTMLRAGVVLKPWPCMMTWVPAPAELGLKLKMLRTPGVTVDRRTSVMLPVGS